MNAPFSIDPGTASTLQLHQDVARYTLSALWSGKWFIAAMVLGSVMLGLGGVALMPLQYKSEAVIQLSFNRDEPTGGQRSQVIATLDATALLESEVQLIRSRATASAVVRRLGLENDPAFTRESRLATALRRLRSALGDSPPLPPPEDRAVAALMQETRVESQPRSYLISVAAISADPEQAKLVANAVAEEYLRQTAMRQLTQKEMSAQTELTTLAATFGKRHPNFQRGLRNLELARKQLELLGKARSVAEMVAAGEGPMFIPADKVLVPSGPNTHLFLMTAGLFGFATGAFLVMCRCRRDERRQAEAANQSRHLLSKVSIISRRSSEPV